MVSDQLQSTISWFPPPPSPSAKLYLQIVGSIASCSIYSSAEHEGGGGGALTSDSKKAESCDSSRKL